MIMVAKLNALPVVTMAALQVLVTDTTGGTRVKSLIRYAFLVLSEKRKREPKRNLWTSLGYAISFCWVSFSCLGRYNALCKGEDVTRDYEHVLQAKPAWTFFEEAMWETELHSG
jgi:hypothetical protein